MAAVARLRWICLTNVEHAILKKRIYCVFFVDVNQIKKAVGLGVKKVKGVGREPLLPPKSVQFSNKFVANN